MNSQDRILLQPRTTLEAMRAERERLQLLKQQSQQRMNKVTQSLFKKEKSTYDRWGAVSKVVESGLAIYQGARMGASFITALRNTFGRKSK